MPRVGEDLGKYLRVEMMPHVWCPGCGHGNIARGLATALDRLQLPLDQVVPVGGIGCSGRTPFYFNANAMHTTHGRALAFATGIKLVNPASGRVFFVSPCLPASPCRCNIFGVLTP